MKTKKVAPLLVMLIFIIFTTAGCSKTDNAAVSKTSNTELSNTEFKISHGKVKLEKVSVLSDQIELLVPKDFKIMTEEMAKVKYPSENRPTLIYTNESGSINVAFNHTEGKVSKDEIQSYKDTMQKTFENLYPSAEWYSNGVVTIDSKNVGYLELLTPALDTKIYSMIFFTELDGRLLVMTFNCTEVEMNDWKPIANKIMHSLKIKN